MLDVRLQAEIEQAVQSALSPIKVASMTLEEGRDHDANDVIFVTVNFPSGTGPLSGEHYLRAMSAASRALLHARDERMPLFRTMREGEPEPLEETADGAP
jgi:hypothetical protein